MFFPYSTDAPIYYFPFGTIGLIVVNVLVFIALATSSESSLESWDQWVLHYGNGIHPLQWISSIFIHGDFLHLLGNMLFLWVFGIIVEGKLGWIRFLPCYLFIGVLQSALEQFAMLGMVGGGSLGASAAIFGIMAMAAVWAPKNDITCAYWFFIFVGVCDIPISVLAAIYIGYDLTIGMLFGTSAITSWLHLSGAIIGFPIGVILLKRASSIAKGGICSTSGAATTAQ